MSTIERQDRAIVRASQDIRIASSIQAQANFPNPLDIFLHDVKSEMKSAFSPPPKSYPYLTRYLERKKWLHLPHPDRKFVFV